MTDTIDPKRDWLGDVMDDFLAKDPEPEAMKTAAVAGADRICVCNRPVDFAGGKERVYCPCGRTWRVEVEDEDANNG